jgi:hypothetical protein
MTRIPELEQELVAAAARLQSPRRVLRPAARAALAVAAAGLLAGVAVLQSTEKDEAGRHRAPTGPQGALGAKVAFDSEAGVGFGLEGLVLTVSVHPEAPSKTLNRLSGARIRATCGQGFTGGQGDPRQESTRFWPSGTDRLRFRFPRDISRIARWCRVEDPVVGHVAFVKFRGATLSPAQRIRRIATHWGALLAAGDPAYCNYSGQPLCERIECQRPGGVPIENCTPMSAESRRSFGDATIEDIAIKGNRAAVRFSNGEAIELGKDTTGFEHPVEWWWVVRAGRNVGRGIFDM